MMYQANRASDMPNGERPAPLEKKILDAAKIVSGLHLLPDRDDRAAHPTLASLGEGGVHGQTKFGFQAAVSAALVN